MIHDGGYFTVFLNWVVRRLCEECGLLELAFLSRRRRRQWSGFWMLLGRTLTSQLPLSHRRRGFPSSGVLCDRCVGERKVRPMYFPRPAYFLSPEVPLRSRGGGGGGQMSLRSFFLHVLLLYKCGFSCIFTRIAWVVGLLSAVLLC